MEIHIFKQYHGVRNLCKTSDSFARHCNHFVSKQKRQVGIEQTQFLSTVFLCSEFKLEDIYSGVNFLGKNVCAIFFFFCGN